jgi:hypothetical protein
MYVMVAVPADPLGKGRTTLDPLTWLLIPLATVVMAALWGCCAGRPRRADDWTNVQHYDRVREALARAAASAASSAPCSWGPVGQTP